MTSLFDNLARRFLGQQYAPVSTSEDPESQVRVPGSFAATPEGNQVANSNVSEGHNRLPGDAPIGEEPATAPRAALTSHNLNHVLFRFSTICQLLVYKPLMVVLVLICRVVAAFINVIYFRDEYAATANNPSDPIDNANKFIRELEYNLQPSEPMHTLPPFFQGSYTQALFMATNRAKFLFVYLAHPRSENSSGMFENIITAPEFTSIFNDPDYIIWGGDLTSSESYQLANSLNVTRFPFLGLMCLTRSTTMMPLGPVKSAPKISLVLKVQGRVKDRARAQAIISNKFKNRINKYEADLREIRHELMNKYMSQVLVKQQDISYQNSLARDKAKKLKREREGKLLAYLQLKVEHFLQLQNSQLPDSARVGIRFSNGNRVTLTLPSTTKVAEIYEFVEIHRRGYDTEPQTLSSQNGQNSQNSLMSLEIAPDDFKFSLVSSVPPRSLLKDFWESSVRDVNFIYPNGMLIVEDI